MNDLNRQLISMYAKQLRVPTFNQYEEVVRQLEGDKGFDDFLVSLMRAELENRQEGNRKRKIRSARFPYTKTLEEFDFSYLEHVSEAQIRQLASCDFIGQKQNVVMIGNPGTGKTHLSIALGLKACMQGLNVRFYTAANLSNELIEALDGHRLLKLEKQIAGCDLLIIDEMSYLTFNRHQSELLFKVIADRSERKSIIVSTNLPFSEWLTIYEGEYTLILDEALDVVMEFNKIQTVEDSPRQTITEQDMKMLLEHSIIKIRPDYRVEWNGGEYGTDFKFAEVERLAKLGVLYCVRNKLLVTVFPPEMFRLFDRVYVLTYMFGGSTLKYYFQLFGLEYEMASVSRGDSGYVLADHTEDADILFRQKFRNLVSVCDSPNLNNRPKRTLSKAWYQKATDADLKQLRNDIGNYFNRHITDARASNGDIMWTCPVDYEPKLRGAGYTRSRNLSKEERSLPEQQRKELDKQLTCFVPCNSRATNIYRNRWALAYCCNMENHIIPYFEEKKILLQDLRTVDLEDYYRSKLQADSRLDCKGALSAQTIKHHHQHISKALNDAIRRGLILANPAAVARTPKVPRFKSEYLNPEQVGEVLEMFAGNTAALPITLCALYGFRRSEAIGLQWKNVDFQRRLITVAATIQQGGGGCYLAEPKTENSYRTLPMMDSIYTILSAQKERQKRNRAILGQGYIESDFVCTWDDGRLITPDYVTREFHKVISKSQLPTIRLHDLRHCVASNLLNSGYSPTDVAAWLGHSSPNTTFGYYAHASKASKEHISNAVQGWFDTNPLDNR